ncbi:MAG: transposase [Prevotellaceae bacterium]|jgi:REP element-mobilizing transposase RayT|nr:transposase [Prevotellaceae bacterium]
MPYDPAIHHRHSIRLKGYDYSQEGLYFITICCQGRICRFGKIKDGKMILNDAGNIAQQCWLDIPQHFPHAELHEYVVMPNHIHGIVELTETVAVDECRGEKFFAHDDGRGEKFFAPKNECGEKCGDECGKKYEGEKFFAPTTRPRGASRTIGSIIRGFKIGVTKQLGGSIWQRNYYEHIIRNEQAHQNISDYIIHNPETWRNDKFYKIYYQEEN